jgi:acetyl/propionyl-CoA carboxylase alpha subunit
MACRETRDSNRCDVFPGRRAFAARAIRGRRRLYRTAAKCGSYLNVAAIISAAEVTGTDAIHPGYRFLSESAHLAEVSQACHISFIGPDPDVVRLPGDKARA